MEREGYILVSSNRSTMPIHLQAHLQKGRHIPGILLLRPRVSYRQIIDTLELIWIANVPEDFQDQIMVKPKNNKTLFFHGRRGFLTSLVQSVRLILKPTINIFHFER